MTGRFSLFTAAVLLGAVIGCDSPSAAGDGSRMTVGFSLSETAAQSAVLDGAAAGSAAGDIVVTGTNGVLTITGIHFIVDEFKLDRAEAACDSAADEDACERFESGPEFVTLPLDGATVPVFTASVPAGTYTDLKFEVKDKGSNLAAVQTALTAAGFTNWPGNASVAVVGTFTPTGGTARPFRAFLDAEVKVEMELQPALVIDGENGAATVEIDPALWFANANGTVVDLSAFDFATTGNVLDFEAKLEHGFTKIELKGFDD